MADGKIYIIVTNELPTGGPGTPGVPKTVEKEETSGGSALGRYAFHRFANFVEGQAVKTVNYAISNIGNFTGDYVSQRETQAVVNGLTKLYNIGNAFVAGSVVTGSPIGGVIAASLAVAGEAVNIALEVHSLEIQQKKSNYEIDQLKLRSGLNALTDGSRGTEN